MRLMMLTGAMLGFGVGITFSLMHGSTWPTVMWHACIAAYVTGIVFRWWARHWVSNLRLALVEKHEAAVRAATPTPSGGPGGSGGGSAVPGAGGTNNTNKR